MTTSTKPTQPGATTEDSVRRVRVYRLPRNIEAFYDKVDGTHALMTWKYHEAREADLNEHVKTIGDRNRSIQIAQTKLDEYKRLSNEMTEAQEAEIERLREALEEINGEMDTMSVGFASRVDDLARRALEVSRDA